MSGRENQLLSEIDYLRDKVDSLEKKNKELRKYAQYWRDLKHALFNVKTGRMYPGPRDILSCCYANVHDIMEDMEIKEEIKTPPKPDMRIKGRLGNP